MIKVMDHTRRVVIGVIRNVVDCEYIEEINGEFVLNFTAILNSGLTFQNGSQGAPYTINENTIYVVDDKLFYTVLYSASVDEDGVATIQVECEHETYLLNNPEFNLQYFAATGLPSEILTTLLDGSPSLPGDVEFTESVSFSIMEESSRRSVLMQFVAFLGGELEYIGRTVNILRHRGSTTLMPVIQDRNVRVVSKQVDKRNTNVENEPIVSYTCEAIVLPNDNYHLGDDVLLMKRELGMRIPLRVICITKNLYDPLQTQLVFSNYINDLSRQIFRIETSSVIKDRYYNGIRIGPEYGFEAIRGDLRARAYFRSDGFVMQSGDGQGNWTDRLYYVYDSDTDETRLVLDGAFSADMIEAVSDLITPYLYSENGIIVNAVVRRLRTDLVKPWRYLQSDTSDVHFQDIGDTDRSSGRYFEVDSVIPDVEPIQFSIPALDGTSGEVPLWWYQGNVGGSMTTNQQYAKPEPTTEDPDPQPVKVMVYQYANSVKHSSELVLTQAGYWGVRDIWGVGTSSTSGRGQGIIEKTDTHMQMIMNPGNGEDIGGIRISESQGVELFNPITKVWEYPSGGSGGDVDWDALEINDSFFVIESQNNIYTYNLTKDSEGRITSINDGIKNRVITYT